MSRIQLLRAGPLPVEIRHPPEVWSKAPIADEPFTGTVMVNVVQAHSSAGETMTRLRNRPLFNAEGLHGSGWNKTFSRPVVVALYVVALMAVVGGVDRLFFRDHLWERLMVNVGIVLVFGAFYLRFSPL